jgi:hypothetical protein
MASSQEEPFDSASLIRAASAAGEWTLEPSGSSVEFAVKHFWGMMTVRGGFAHLEGSAHVASEGTVSAELGIEAGSVSTRQKKRDAHLRSAGFLRCPESPPYRGADQRHHVGQPHHRDGARIHDRRRPHRTGQLQRHRCPLARRPGCHR